MKTTTTIRTAAAAILAFGVLAGPAFAEPEKKTENKEITSESLKEKVKEKSKEKEGDAPKATPAPAKTGFAALKDRVAELREIAKDLKQNDRDKAAAKVNAVADQLEKDIAAMEKAAPAATGETPKAIKVDGAAATEPGREGNKGQGVGHGKPAEPGTGKPATVGPPAAKAEKAKPEKEAEKPKDK